MEAVRQAISTPQATVRTPPEPPSPPVFPELFDDGPCPGPTGAVFDRWRHFGPSPRLARAIGELRAGLAGGTALARLEDPRLHLETLERILTTDPVLTSTVLRLANSAQYGMRTPVASLPQAIGILGLTGIQTVLYAELLDAAAARSGLRPELRLGLQEHLAVAATLARHIAPAFPGLEPRQLETMAILHDIGKLVLYQGGASAFHDDLAAEVGAFGVDHALTGALVCQVFDLPPAMLASIALHHAPQYVELEELQADMEEIRYALALSLTNRLAHGLDPVGAIRPRPSVAASSPDRSLPPAIRDSYRFLVKEPVLATCLADPALARAVSQTRSLVRDLNRS